MVVVARGTAGDGGRAVCVGAKRHDTHRAAGSTRGWVLVQDAHASRLAYEHATGRKAGGPIGWGTLTGARAGEQEQAAAAGAMPGGAARWLAAAAAAAAAAAGCGRSRWRQKPPIGDCFLLRLVRACAAAEPVGDGAGCQVGEHQRDLSRPPARPRAAPAASLRPADHKPVFLRSRGCRPRMVPASPRPAGGGRRQLRPPCARGQQQPRLQAPRPSPAST